MKLDISELIRRYPLTLALPSGGTFHMLIWNAHETGNRMTLAPREAQLVEVFQAVLREYGVVDLKAHWRMTVVAPPRAYVEKFAVVSYEEAAGNFAQEVVWLVGHVLSRDGGDLTDFPGLRLCDRLAESGHRDECWACYATGRLPLTYSWEDFYEMHRGVMEGEQNRSRRANTDPREVPSPDLPEADPGREIYLAVLDRGPHRDGIQIRVYGGYEPHGGDELFFFQGERLPVPQALLNARQELIRELEEKSRQRVSELDAHRAAEDEQRRQSVIALFPECRAILESSGKGGQ